MGFIFIYFCTPSSGNKRYAVRWCVKVVQSHLRSSKLTNRNLVCDFLLESNSNPSRISDRFRHKALAKIVTLYLMKPVWCQQELHSPWLPGDETPHDPTFIYIDSILACDRQRDN